MRHSIDKSIENDRTLNLAVFYLNLISNFSSCSLPFHWHELNWHWQHVPLHQEQLQCSFHWQYFCYLECLHSTHSLVLSTVQYSLWFWLETDRGVAQYSNPGYFGEGTMNRAKSWDSILLKICKKEQHFISHFLDIVIFGDVRTSVPNTE